MRQQRYKKLPCFDRSILSSTAHECRLSARRQLLFHTLQNSACTEATFPELQARITKISEFLSGFKPAQIDGTEEKSISLKVGGNDLSFKGQPYLLGFVIPNFYFHLSIAYAILRHSGVEIGKMDFLGNIQ